MNPMKRIIPENEISYAESRFSALTHESTAVLRQVTQQIAPFHQTEAWGTT